MKRVLVIGGTRFVGRRLVKHLLDSGAAVTIVSRGQVADPFGDSVERLIADRCDRDAFARAIAGRTWDMVYDQVCYSPNEAAMACELLDGKIGRYIMASTQSVYDGGPSIPESAFDPYSAVPRPGWRDDFTYMDCKRFGEAVFFQMATFPVAAIRWPLLVGSDDYTGRVWWHIDRIRQGLPVGIPDPSAKTAYINSQEAADFAFWLGDRDLTGPVNACSSGAMAYADLMALAGQAVGRKPIIVTEGPADVMSPIAHPGDWYMSNARAEAAGFKFSSFGDWMPDLIKALADPGYVVPKV